MKRSWDVYHQDRRRAPGPPPGSPPRVLLDNIRSAFNVGSVFRTCEAVGVRHLHLCGICAYPPNARVLKTALGADRMVSWNHSLSAVEEVERLRKAGVQVLSVELTDRSRPYHEIDYPADVVFVFGHEVSGVAVPILDRSAAVIQIPMMGRKNSLNIATSVGVILFDHLVRRLQHPAAERSSRSAERSSRSAGRDI